MAVDVEGEVKDVEVIQEVKDRTVGPGPTPKYGDLLVCRQAYRLALRVSEFTNGKSNSNGVDSFGGPRGRCLQILSRAGRSGTPRPSLRATF